jgi:hypothetical protein
VKARDIIEAEDPKSVFKQIAAQPYAFKVTPLTWREIERLSDIIAMGPLTKRPSDEKFFELGYVQHYDDMLDTVEARQGFPDALFNDPEIRGGIGKEWIAENPHQESENPKSTFQKLPRSSANAEVESSSGIFTIDGLSGRVIEWKPYDAEDAETGYHRIERFDLDEWRAAHNWVGPLPLGYDVLDLGMWLRDGTYEPPAAEYRATMESIAERACC